MPSTLDADDFRVSLSNGISVTPQVTSIWPNFEYNERSVAVLFGHFGNRVPPSQPGAIYPTSVQVVRGSSALELVGPGQRIVSAVGFSARTPGSPYTRPGIPPGRARRSRPRGREAQQDVGRGQHRAPDLPPEPAQRRGEPVRQPGKVPAPDVHVGRHDPNGVTPLLPTDYDQYFRVIAVTSSGRKVALTRAGRTCYIDGKPLRVVGLANLGRKQASYDAC